MGYFYSASITKIRCTPHTLASSFCTTLCCQTYSDNIFVNIRMGHVIAYFSDQVTRFGLVENERGET